MFTCAHYNSNILPLQVTAIPMTAQGIMHAVVYHLKGWQIVNLIHLQLLCMSEGYQL